MGKQVVGNINVALIFGLGQFVSTFLIAWLYSRYMNRHVDPLAEGELDRDGALQLLHQHHAHDEPWEGRAPSLLRHPGDADGAQYP